jgi:hypothetical protein
MMTLGRRLKLHPALHGISGEWKADSSISPLRRETTSEKYVDDAYAGQEI